MFYDVIYLSTLTSSCCETDVIWSNIVCTYMYLMMPSKKETDFGSQELQDGKGMY